MFSKNTEKLESFIGAKSSFKGNIKTEGTLRIDGSVEGNIEVDWLILGETADIKGDVKARGIIVGGKINGNLSAKELIEIRSKGYLTGEIVTNKLVVAEGGILEGRSSMQRESSNVVELQAAEKNR